jgi:hypothetical protein
MPVGIYKHKPNQGFQKGHKSGTTGKKMSDETKRKISIANKGKKFTLGKHWKMSEEHKRKLSEAHKGKIPWKGKHHTKESKKKMSKSQKGRKASEETRKKMSESQKGEKSYLWKGGLTEANDTVRHGIDYRLWREAVFARDNWTCQKTGIKGGKLCAHHINNFADYPELRFAIDNGITLSRKSHDEFHQTYGKKNNTREQLNEFLCKE